MGVVRVHGVARSELISAVKRELQRRAIAAEQSRNGLVVAGGTHIRFVGFGASHVVRVGPGRAREVEAAVVDAARKTASGTSGPSMRLVGVAYIVLGFAFVLLAMLLTRV
jgi:hypothetical protein